MAPNPPAGRPPAGWGGRAPRPSPGRGAPSRQGAARPARAAGNKGAAGGGERRPPAAPGPRGGRATSGRRSLGRGGRTHRCSTRRRESPAGIWPSRVRCRRWSRGAGTPWRARRRGAAGGSSRRYSNGAPRTTAILGPTSRSARRALRAAALPSAPNGSLTPPPHRAFRGPGLPSAAPPAGLSVLPPPPLPVRVAAVGRGEAPLWPRRRRGRAGGKRLPGCIASPWGPAVRRGLCPSHILPRNASWLSAAGFCTPSGVSGPDSVRVTRGANSRRPQGFALRPAHKTATASCT